MVSFSEDDLVELGILRALEIDDLVDLGLLPRERRFDEDLLSSLTLKYDELVLDIRTGETYPAEQLHFEITNLCLPRLKVDSLKIELRSILVRDAEANNIKTWNSRAECDPFGVFEFQKSALHLVQKTVERLAGYHDQPLKPLGDTTPLKYKNDEIPLPGVDLSAIKEDAVAVTVLGTSLENICSTIPKEFRILHAESVIRHDLLQKFRDRQEEIRERLQRYTVDELRKSLPKEERRSTLSKDEAIEYLLKPHLTFHGTSNEFVPSIVRNGFLNLDDINPSNGEVHEVRCGSTYGRGIYSSPSADFSLAYTDEDATPTKSDGFWGVKLIVCATVLGRCTQVYRQDNWRWQDEPYPGADSHAANNGWEYIVFDKRQIIPCYVIHLDWGEENEWYFVDIRNYQHLWRTFPMHPKLLEPLQSPGEQQEEKEDLIARGAKAFPFGYGPATGTKFTILEIGEVDDDEEDYGEYQVDQLQGVGVGEKSRIWEWDPRLQDVKEYDEYTEEKLASRRKS